MSSFIVSENHLNTILSYVNSEQANNPYLGQYNYEDLSRIGQMFSDENQKGYADRYNQDIGMPEFIYKPINTSNVTPMQFIKLLDCLDYQCNESDDYESTETHKLIERWRKVTYKNLPEYRNAKWDID